MLQSYFKSWTSLHSSSTILLSSNNAPSSSSSSPPPQQQPPPLPNTKDPFILLGLQTPTADKTLIKRAYKRMALLYHPDVRITSTSSTEEKKRANDDFARINDAYDRLTSTTVKDTTTNGDPRSNSSPKDVYTYQPPPHRRTATTHSKTVENGDIDNGNIWENYVQNQSSSEEYNTQGDSFEAILSDLFSNIADGAAGVVAEGVRRGKEQKSGILHDLIEFLEQNVNPLGSFQNDKEDILDMGTIQDISLEMEDIQLLISQLERKREDLEEEIRKLQVDVDKSLRFVEKMEMKERLDELLARKKIVMEYLNKSRERYGKLQQKYKDLKLQSRYGRNTATSSSSSSSSSSGAGSSSSRRYPVDGDFKTGKEEPSINNIPSSQQQTTVSNTGETTSSSSTWKRESFGSYGRRSSRASRDHNTRDVSSAINTDINTSPKADATTPSSSAPSQAMWSSKDGKIISSDPIISVEPPHRRMTGSTSYKTSDSRKAQGDKKRLRDLKVDEEFERLKREMGL